MTISRLMAMMATVTLLTFSASAATAGTPATLWSTPEHQRFKAAFSDVNASAITVTLQARSPFDPMNAYAVVLASNSGTPAMFSGNLTGINGARFKVVTDQSAPERVALWLRGSSGRIWTCEAQFTTVTNTCTVNFVPFDRTKATWTAPLGMPAAQVGPAWAADLASVDQLGVYVKQSSLDAQTLAIGDFQLEGQDYTTEFAQLSRLERILWSDYRVIDTSAVHGDIGKNTDSDDDGLTDLEERIAGTDPGLARSVFEIRIVAQSDEEALLQWPCVEGATYTILSRSTMDAAPQVVASGLRPTSEELAAGTMTRPAQGAATAYYELNVQ